MKDNWFSELIFRLIRPSFWLQNYPTNYDWSDLVEQLIDANAVITYIDEYKVMFNDDVAIWISNYPYAYGHPYYIRGINGSQLPTARVRAKLRRYIAKYHKRKMQAEFNRVISRAATSLKNVEPKL